MAEDKGWDRQWIVTGLRAACLDRNTLDPWPEEIEQAEGYMETGLFEEKRATVHSGRFVEGEDWLKRMWLE